VLEIIICGVGFVTVLAVLSWLSRDSRAEYSTRAPWKSWSWVAATAVCVGSGVVVALLLRMDDTDQVSSAGRAADEPSRTGTPAPSTAASKRSTESAVASTPRIETTTTVYFGRPFETVDIPGRYRGVQGSRELRVQLLRDHVWRQFPLPVVTRQSGEFRAYVYVGKPGTYRLRIVDPAERRSSKSLTLQLF
jgi:hypothetical protein